MKTGRDIIVIGASAGGLEALDNLIGQLPSDLAAAIFVVQHLSPQNSGVALLTRLRKHRTFDCQMAKDQQRFRMGKVYVAPPDQHILIKRNRILVTKGARENRYRPAIDPLFRSAAVNHGPRVIGVILTGMLDDGTSGLSAIKKCGGATVVQHPKDAAYPEMAETAISNVEVDCCVPISEMGQALERLVSGPRGNSKPVPEDIAVEAVIAERVLSDVAQINRLGDQVPYNCPNCGGVLWAVKSFKKVKHYRCHTGHSFTAKALLTSQSEKIEETLWVALRMFEERKNLLNKMAQSERKHPGKSVSAERAAHTEVHINRIRSMLLAQQSK
jgi:two-component system chemotaxis response regulator CheB